MRNPLLYGPHKGGSSEIFRGPRSLVGQTPWQALLNDAALNFRLNGDANGDGTGDANDFAGNYNGTWTGTPTYADPPSATDGKAFDFAPGRQIDVGTVAAQSFIQNTQVFTMAFWLKLNSHTARYIIAGNANTNSERGCIAIFENGAGAGTKAIRFAIYNGTATQIDVRTPTNTIVDTNWHHVAIKCSAAGDNFTIAVDDVSQSLTYATSFGSLSTGNSTRTLNIGRTNAVAALQLSGLISDFWLLDRHLSSAESTTIYEGP